MSPQRRRPALATPAAGTITRGEDRIESSSAQVAPLEDETNRSISSGFKPDNRDEVDDEANVHTHNGFKPDNRVAAEVEHERRRYRRAVERAHDLRVELARCDDERLDALGRLAVLGRSPWWPEHAHRHPETHPRPSVVPGPVLARALRGLERVRRLDVVAEAAA